MSSLHSKAVVVIMIIIIIILIIIIIFYLLSCTMINENKLVNINTQTKSKVTTE